MGFIYVLDSDDIPYFKLGYSTDVGKRFGDLNTAIPFDIELRFHVLGTRNDELACHRLLAQVRKKNEWYCCTRSAMLFLDDLEATEPDQLSAWLASVEPIHAGNDFLKLRDGPDQYWWE